MMSREHFDYRWEGPPRKCKVPRSDQILLVSDKLSLVLRDWKIEGDTSVMTYKGHRVLQCHIRCRFSPAHTTGQVDGLC